jgi:enamine deaminase RidA (YjgF/YER057c/UK114 family)
MADSRAQGTHDAAHAVVVGSGHRAAARVGDLLWLGSQAAATGDVEAGTRAAIAALSDELRLAGFAVEDLVRLGTYHVPGVADEAIRRAIRKALPAEARPVLNVLSVRELALPGAAVAIDGAAAIGPRSDVGDGAFPQAVRVGERIWVGGTRGVGDGIFAQTRDVLARLRSTVAEAGAELDDCVKMNISYVGDGTEEDWEPTAKLRGGAFREPAAAATGIPYPGLPEDALTQFEMVAVAGSVATRRHGWPEGHWDWPIHLPWKHACRAGNLVTVGGQVSIDGRGQPVDPGDLARQTDTALRNIERVLQTVGAAMADVTQVTAFFEGSADDLETVLSRTRVAFGSEPPPMVPVPLPFLAYRDMVVEIEVIAVAPPDSPPF